ncbi:MAG: Tim44/TimA family putative adaptor protein [Hyphomicrobium sp.]
MDLITLISLIVAAVAIFKLRSVLGSRTDEDENRVERLKAREREAQKAQGAAGAGEVITLPRRPRDDVASPLPEPANDTDARIRAYAAIDPSVTSGLLDVAKYDASLDPDVFLRGAGAAYEMIISAFASGDRKTLKDLLSRDVYDSFVAAIAEREQRGEKIEQQFVGIKRGDIVEAEMKGGTASLTVRFVSELITAVLDKSGTVVSGDPQKITDVTDIWTFSRDVSNARALANPNWRLVATQAPN